MTNNDKLKEMFNLQQKLNVETNGLGWEQGVASNGKIINWRRCILLELAELIDSYPWKHWKDVNAEVDIENAKIELVDIWHFLMSELLRMEYLFGNAKNDSLIKDFYKFTNFVQFTETKDTTDAPIDIYKQIAKIEQMMIHVLPNDGIFDLTNEFFDLCIDLGLTFDELYRIYIGKNVLNKFRQDNGYKEGTYVKIWNGREDNVVMQELINNNVNFDSLYKLLAENYPK